MPFKLPMELQSEENKKWLEECSQAIRERNAEYSQEDATNICGTHLVKSKGNKKRANIGVINFILEEFSQKRNQERK